VEKTAWKLKRDYSGGSEEEELNLGEAEVGKLVPLHRWQWNSQLLCRRATDLSRPCPQIL
jgi:hypothetical protein